MRILFFTMAALALVLALPTTGVAMGSGPHPGVLYGIPVTPNHGARVITADAVPPAPSIWDHPIYVIAGGIGGGEMLLWGLMVMTKATRRAEDE